MKQYRGGHDETWGGVEITIDSNWLDLGHGSRPRRERQHCGGVRLSHTRYPKLTLGATGSRVEALQCLLTRQDRYTGPIDGVFGEATRVAVRAVRDDRDLGPGAVVGPSTWSSLLSEGRAKVLKYGAAGERTRQLQRALNAAVGARLEVTGVYEGATTAAVAAYQDRVGAPETGVVTARTWAQLRAGRR